MRRREFISLLGGAVVWPLSVRAQQSDRVRRVGVLMNVAAESSEAQPRLMAFVEALQKLGWNERDNMRIEVRWGANSTELDRRYAAELVALAPDVIVAAGTLSVEALQKVARSVPIVFCNIADPVGAGFVDSLARPGGNATGFSLFEYSISAKWVDLLKEIMPGLTRVAVVRDPSNPAGIAQFGVMQATTQTLGAELRPVSIISSEAIERTITAFASEPNGGLIVTPSVAESTHRDLIINLAARYRLPAVYPFRFWAVSGGLVSYGPDPIDQMRHAADYVDRILKGAKPSNLPVQLPTRYQLVVNLKTAKALDLKIPPAVLTRADEVIE
jgi:putative tryptophan/tyrosine transport system substrate-binding protein